MECPVDGTKLEAHPINSIHVGECDRCKGLWFEQAELHKALEESGPGLDWLDFDLWSDHGSFEADWSTRKCPSCGKNMATISYADTEVTVDFCVVGHGIWLDKGEFQAIIAALQEELASKDISDYVAASLEEAKEVFVGDEGFASEWKDFMQVTRLLQYRVLVENPKVAELLVALQASSPFRYGS